MPEIDPPLAGVEHKVAPYLAGPHGRPALHRCYVADGGVPYVACMCSTGHDHDEAGYDDPDAPAAAPPGG